MTSTGISAEQAFESMNIFSNAVRKLVEMYLTKEEVEEINNPDTSKRRRKQLIDIANFRMRLEFLKEDGTR